ncbi:MAG: recombinase family protein, partial [Firmicutes bacterium]|nr:recombinase family protein [Bacillota bacterium]
KFGESSIVEYCDDGISGRSMERADMKRLICDICDDKIKMIVVKDMSRIGRNYKEVGEFTEIFLRERGVRLISVNDCYDSLYDSDKMIEKAVRDIMNETYSRELSQKIKAAKDMSKSRGEFIAPFAVYGFKKKDGQRYLQTEDKESRKVIERAKRLKEKGYTCDMTAEIFNREGIATPYDYARGRNERKWNGRMVGRIIRNYEHTLMRITRDLTEKDPNF